MPTPEREFFIEYFGEEMMWMGGPHNLVLELLNQLGMIAGPISILVLGYFVCRCVAVLRREPSCGVQSLAIATIAGLVVGGLTLPYMVQDRIGEYLFMGTGMAIGSAVSARQVATAAQSTSGRA